MILALVLSVAVHNGVFRLIGLSKLAEETVIEANGVFGRVDITIAILNTCQSMGTDLLLVFRCLLTLTFLIETSSTGHRRLYRLERPVMDKEEDL